MRIPVILLLLHVLLNTTVSGQLSQQMDIEGWATHTKGGLGGRIVRVTNLNPSGNGSFADAISQSGPRIIVFEVGGIINLNGSTISLKNPYVTIAGQTAPGNGITLINGGMNIQAHDVILQHIRIRPGATGHTVGTWEPDAMSTIGAWNVIIDHCSFSWAVDENCSASGNRFEGATPTDWRLNTSHKVTISNNIIAEGLSLSTHTKGEHSKGTLVHDNTDEIAILNNLYAHNVDRSPLFKGGARGVVVNNYIYNPGVAAVKFGLVDSEWLGYTHLTGKMSVVGNVLQYGPDTKDIPLCNIGNGPCEVYVAENIARNRSGGMVADYKGDANKRVYTKPIWNDNIKVLPASEVQQNVIRQAGARYWQRDAVDTRILLEMKTQTGKIIHSESSVGGYPNDTLTLRSFREIDWNLDALLPITSGTTLLPPVNAGFVRKDSDFLISVASSKSDLSLELFLNGKSQGTLENAPYQWPLRIPETGTYRLFVVSKSVNTIDSATVTTEFQVIENNQTGLVSKMDIQNPIVFPNPFCERTTIRYHLPSVSNVSISLFNSLGSSLGTILSETQSMGVHELAWEPENLPKGLYLLQLKTDFGSFCLSVIHTQP